MSGEENKNPNVINDTLTIILNTLKRKNLDRLKVRASKMPFKLKNRFDPLSKLSEHDNDSSNESSDMETTEQPSPPKKERPPAPIVLNGVPENTDELTNQLKLICKKPFSLKYGNTVTNIHFTSLEDKKNFQSKLGPTTEYFTYTEKEERTHAFVMRGLDCEVNIETILQDLKGQNSNIKSVYKMKTKYRPLYLVITNKQTKLQDMDKIKIVFYTRIKWEKHVNKKLIIQCKRCQIWGHATSNCHNIAKCLKCAEHHWTKDCTKPLDKPAKCANCEGDHPANSTSCASYLEKITFINKNKRQHQKVIQPRYIEAPPPSTNAWQNRTTRRYHSQPEQPTCPPTTEEFPPLPTPGHRESHYNDAPRSFEQNRLQNSSDASELFREMKRFNELINVEGLLKLYRDMNAQLSLARTSEERLMTTMSFVSRASHYGI